MRSVFVYLKDAEIEVVRKFLNEVYPSQVDQWIYSVDNDPCLYIAFYDDFDKEASEQEIAELNETFGALPKTCLMVNVSGRHDGYREVLDLMSSVLNRFDGLAQDDWSDGFFWTLDEILSKREKGDDQAPFFHYRRHLP